MIYAVMGCWLLGVIWRALRRMLKLPPRVVHGIAPLHSLRDSVSADRTVGVNAVSVVLYARQNSVYDLTTEKEFDYVVSSTQSTAHRKYWKCLCQVLLRADIWSASFTPFWPGHYRRLNPWIMRLVRIAGIRIIAYPYGTDGAGRDRCRDRFDWIAEIQKDYPLWDMREHYDQARFIIDLFCRFSDLIIGMDGSVRRFLPRNDVYCKTIPVDTEKLKPDMDFQGNAIPLIVHAPNHRHVKGTQFLLEALDEVRAAGIPFELKLVERVARNEAIEIYKSADLIADQFIMGAYGVFALECLALGKPVLTYLDHDHLCNPVFNLPIVNTNRWNLSAVVTCLLSVPGLRERIGRAGRDAVVQYQSLEVMGELNKAMYDHVWWGKPLNLEGTRHFGPEREPRSFTENPRDPDFWPVPVADLLPQIRLACDKVVGCFWATDAAGPIVCTSSTE